MDDGGELATKDATELAAMIRAKEVSSRELLGVYLDRIERLDGVTNAVVTLDAERATEAATRADEATQRGEAAGPLHGLPITIKDAIEVGGMRSTGGATALADHVPSTDAPVVAALKAAGAIVFGKTNVPEWSGDLQTYNELFGTTNNPWDPSKIPGGSSGGAAVAVACGYTSFEIGTDIGGSVRGPSHCNGVFGLKPSFGVVPQRGYLDHPTGGTTDADINCFGPIARSARDLDLLLGIIAGPPPEATTAWRIELPAPRPGHDTPRGLRVGTWFDAQRLPVASDVRTKLRQAADTLADAGANVDDAHPPLDVEEQLEIFHHMIVGAISPSMAPADGDAVSGSHRAWLEMERRRAALRRTWAEWFESYDVLLCPVYATPAFPHDHNPSWADRTVDVDGVAVPYMVNVEWPGLIGIAGLPSAVPPLGRSAGGLPVGIQCVTPFLRDREAVEVASWLGRYEPPPAYH